MGKRPSTEAPVTFVNLDRPKLSYPCYEELSPDTWFRTVNMPEHDDCIFFKGSEDTVVCFMGNGAESYYCAGDVDITDETLVEELSPKNIQFTF